MSLSVNTGINKQKGQVKFNNPNSALEEVASDDHMYDELTFGQAISKPCCQNEICEGEAFQDE